MSACAPIWSSLASTFNNIAEIGNDGIIRPHIACVPRWSNMTKCSELCPHIAKHMMILWSIATNMFEHTSWHIRMVHGGADKHPEVHPVQQHLLVATLKTNNVYTQHLPLQHVQVTRTVTSNGYKRKYVEEVFKRAGRNYPYPCRAMNTCLYIFEVGVGVWWTAGK